MNGIDPAVLDRWITGELDYNVACPDCLEEAGIEIDDEDPEDYVLCPGHTRQRRERDRAAELGVD